MNNPRISIITVTYNNQSTIEATIKSVLNQTYKNIQYIIIDGQSKDNTLSIIRKYSQQIDIIISEPDEGAYYAINKGILYATGDVIGILHADDFYADEKVIEKVVKAFNSFNSSVVYGDLLYVDRNDENKIIRYWQSCQYNSTLLKKGWMPPHPTLFISKEKYSCGFSIICFGSIYPFLYSQIISNTENPKNMGLSADEIISLMRQLFSLKLFIAKLIKSISLSDDL